MRNSGLNVLTKTPFSKVTKLSSTSPPSLQVHLENGEIVTSEIVLLALGRPGNIEGLGLEKTGIKTLKGGFVWVDEFNNTTVPGVYAIGDLI